MKKVAIIGAGISGMTVGHLLKAKYEVTIFEKEMTPGGLIRCKKLDEGLFHMCGGHVFNTKYVEVFEWVKQFVNFEEDYLKVERNSSVVFDDGLHVPYPIENHIYHFPGELQKKCIKDLLQIAALNRCEYLNFEDFLQKRFGNTLYQLYFKPYNEKVWRCSLKQIPLSWLEGKLPMPTVEEILFDNMNHVEERKFVHSTFWYPKKNGSQFFADKLAEGLNIRYGQKIGQITFCEGSKMWSINGETYDKVVFCGNVKQMPLALSGVDIAPFVKEIESLQYHGTTTVFCEIEKNPYSWMYLPCSDYQSHRIICTGNFSPSNNAKATMTATVEFTDEINSEQIISNLKRMPYSPKYITHEYNRYTYPIQYAGTRELFKALKQQMAEKNLFITGRFADWEYYNMDVAIKAAMDTCRAL